MGESERHRERIVEREPRHFGDFVWLLLHRARSGSGEGKRHGVEAVLRKNLLEPADECFRREVESGLLLHLAAHGGFSRLKILDMSAGQTPQPVERIDVTPRQEDRPAISGRMDDGSNGGFRHGDGGGVDNLAQSRKFTRKIVQRVFHGKRFSQAVGDWLRVDDGFVMRRSHAPVHGFLAECQ